MKFYTIQIPVTVTGDGSSFVQAALTISITTGDGVSHQGAADRLAEKLGEAMTLVDIGDEE